MKITYSTENLWKKLEICLEKSKKMPADTCLACGEHKHYLLNNHHVKFIKNKSGRDKSDKLSNTIKLCWNCHKTVHENKIISIDTSLAENIAVSYIMNGADTKQTLRRLEKVVFINEVLEMLGSYSLKQQSIIKAVLPNIA